MDYRYIAKHLGSSELLSDRRPVLSPKLTQPLAALTGGDIQATSEDCVLIIGSKANKLAAKRNKFVSDF